VEGADTYHYRTLADYIHLNPVRARLVVPEEGPKRIGLFMEQRGGLLGLATREAPEMVGRRGGTETLRSAGHGGRPAAYGGAHGSPRSGGGDQSTNLVTGIKLPQI